MRQVKSGPVVVNVSFAVKELVENSLDAGATSIEVRFANRGIDSITVRDDGCGISPEDHAAVARSHWTSKLKTYDDLSSLNTYGFRGEALSCICAMATLQITTRASNCTTGSWLHFKETGELQSSGARAYPRGTSAVVKDLLRKFPVRKNILKANSKNDYNSALTLLRGYACFSTGVRFTVSNTLRLVTRVHVLASVN